VFEIGNSLREARLRRQIEFVEAEHGTKIRGKYLRALEDERFELLPSHTYVKGFLRSYAEYLGLDGQLYVDEYNSRYVTGEDDAAMRATTTRRVPAARARRTERRESNIVLLALSAIGLVTALVIVAWRFGGVEQEPVQGLTTPQKTVAAAPQAAGTVRLEVRATRGDSYMIVKSRSALGDVLYQGTLERGQKQLFDDRVLWVTLETPANVLVKLNGNRIKLPKKAVKAQGVFVTAKKVFAADAR
jgi:cytoskeletal protein RodZ